MSGYNASTIHDKCTCNTDCPQDSELSLMVLLQQIRGTIWGQPSSLEMDKDSQDASSVDDFINPTNAVLVDV